MKDQDEDIPFEEGQIDTSSDYSKTARKGFYLMLSGPAVLLIWSLILPIVIALDIVFLILIVIIGAAAFFLPLAGLINAVRSLFWHSYELDNTGRALAIITCIMCNPLFYIFYFFVCISAVLTGEINLSGGFSM
jgi:hypothetical protein